MRCGELDAGIPSDARELQPGCRYAATVGGRETEVGARRRGRLAQFVVEAESRVAEADSEYYRSLVDYNLSAVGFTTPKAPVWTTWGSTSPRDPGAAAAYRSAAKESRRFKPRLLNYCLTEPCPVSRGPYPQQTLSRDGAEIVPLPPATETPAAPEPILQEPLPGPPEAELPPDPSIPRFEDLDPVTS